MTMKRSLIIIICSILFVSCLLDGSRNFNGIKTALKWLVVSCHLDGSRNIDGIDIDYMLIYDAEKEQNTDYCELVRKSLKKDLSSIKQLALLDYDGGYFYEHGMILLDIVDRIGENVFIESLKDISLKQKEKVLECMYAGIELRNSQKNDNN